MDLEFTLGKTEESMKAIITMIRNMDMGNIAGQMEESSKGSGQMVNVRVKAK